MLDKIDAFFKKAFDAADKHHYTILGVILTAGAMWLLSFGVVSVIAFANMLGVFK